MQIDEDAITINQPDVKIEDIETSISASHVVKNEALSMRTTNTSTMKIGSPKGFTPLTAKNKKEPIRETEVKNEPLTEAVETKPIVDIKVEPQSETKWGDDGASNTTAVAEPRSLIKVQIPTSELGHTASGALSSSYCELKAPTYV